MSFIDKLLLFFYKVRINAWLQRYESVVLVFDEMESFYESNYQMHNEISELIISSLRIVRLLSKDKFDETKKIKEKIEDILPNLTPESCNIANVIACKFIIHFYLDISYYYFKINELDKMIYYLKESLDKAQQLANPFYLFITYNALINHNMDSEKGSDFNLYMTEAETVLDKFQKPLLKIRIFQNLSADYMWTGKLEEGLKYNNIVNKLLSSLETEEESFYYLKYYSLICLGIISLFMGKYADTQEWTLKAEEYAKIIAERFEDPLPLSSVYGNMGELYLNLEKNTESFNYLIKGLNLRLLQPDAITHLSDSYYCLIRLMVRKNDIKEAENYLRRFETFITKWNNELVIYADLFNAYFSVAKATILMAKKSMKTNSEAQVLLRKIVEENKVKTEIIINALLPLIELTIQEFKLFQSETSFQDLRNLIRNLNDLVKQTSSISLKIQSLIIQGKLNIVLGEFDQFEKFLNEARKLAKEYELTNVEKWITAELDNFQAELKKWQSLIVGNVSLRKRIELIQLEDYVKGIQHILAE